MGDTFLGIIGGSGIYDLPEVENASWKKVDTPWGDPSDEIRVGTLKGKKIAFLPRHGRGHFIPPSEINYRANIDALKRVGVTDLISVSACGSLKTEHEPGKIVVVDQFIDWTKQRAGSFFGKGCVAHVSMAYPVSPETSRYVVEALNALDIHHSHGGTYVAIEGPQFSSRAESELYRSWQADVIGMTNMPEAKLAREAEICYSSVCMVTDFDCWHPDYGEVDIPKLLKVLRYNSENAAKVIVKLAEIFPEKHPACPISSDRSLEFAIITPPEKREKNLVAKLDAIAGRVIHR